MIVRKAYESELNDIMKMYKSCVKGMIRNGIDQWDSSYPNSEIITSDLLAGTYYVAKIKNEIIGGINIDQNQDKTYLSINWKLNSRLSSMRPTPCKKPYYPWSVSGVG